LSGCARVSFIVIVVVVVGVVVGLRCCYATGKRLHVTLLSSSLRTNRKESGR